MEKMKLVAALQEGLRGQIGSVQLDIGRGGSCAGRSGQKLC